MREAAGLAAAAAAGAGADGGEGQGLQQPPGLQRPPVEGESRESQRQRAQEAAARELARAAAARAAAAEAAAVAEESEVKRLSPHQGAGYGLLVLHGHAIACVPRCRPSPYAAPVWSRRLVHACCVPRRRIRRMPRRTGSTVP